MALIAYQAEGRLQAHSNGLESIATDTCSWRKPPYLISKELFILLAASFATAI